MRHLAQLGGKLGVIISLAGFVLVFIGWNGAASQNFVPAQFPYLVSGGIGGLCLVVVGVGLIIVQNQRTDRARLEAALQQLIVAVERSAGRIGARPAGGAAADTVLAGESSYHRLDCRLVAGRDDVEAISVDEAAARRLTPCRVCQPVVVHPLVPSELA
ncbi:MAG: hypothetical protein ACRD29_18460 [Acidimicrobiales bacterium]